MVFTRRLAAIRLIALIALVVTAAMTVDLVYPAQSFCPLEEACDRAHESELGALAGVPTEVVGLAAFSLFFAFTLLPVEWARPVLRPAGLLAFLAGLGFVAYQAWVLRSFCPLCLVVDAAAVVAGVIVATWPAPPLRLSGLRVGLEATSVRVAWLLAAVLAVVAPFAWPRSSAPSSGQWVELAGPVLSIEDEEIPEVEGAREEDGDAAVDPPTHPGRHPEAPPEHVPSPRPDPDWQSVPTAPRPPPAPAPPKPAGLARPADEGLATVSPHPPSVTEPPVDEPAPPVVVNVVEYLNPYCKFCRATHQRFEKVLAITDAEVRLHRIYAWGGKGYPAWARACAYAATKGREDALFAELIRSRGQQASEIYAAARRAGLDPRALRVALLNPVPSSRLVRDRKLVQRAGLQGLPTLDIGTRRLMGEQSEAELRAALDAAMHPDPR